MSRDNRRAIGNEARTSTKLDNMGATELAQDVLKRMTLELRLT
jgi:hypothetical protein